MNIVEVGEKIRDVWAANEKLRKFCQDEYGKLPSIFFGMDEENPPAAEYFPMLCIYELHPGGGMTGNTKQHTLLVGVALEDSKIGKDELKRTYTYTGLLKVEKLRNLAEQALISARLGKVNWQGESGPIYKFPLFTSMSVVTVEIPNNKGRRD